MSQGAEEKPLAWAIVSDLFLRAKVEALTDRAEMDVRFFGTPEELGSALTAAALDGSSPALLLVDLADGEGRGMTLLERLSHGTAPPTLAFYSHVEDAVRRRALELGATKVVPRSAFVLRFGDLVRELIG